MITFVLNILSCGKQIPKYTCWYFQEGIHTSKSLCFCIRFIGIMYVTYNREYDYYNNYYTIVASLLTRNFVPLLLFV